MSFVNDYLRQNDIEGLRNRIFSKKEVNINEIMYQKDVDRFSIIYFQI